jgi:16S rRNA (cytosine967-C5)-methyltransferase
VVADPARQAALAALRAVRERDAYANLVLPAVLRSRGLHGRDAARATDLTYGTLRGLGTYDQVLDACATRPLAEAAPDVVDALRLGAYQLLGAGVAPHAAVSTTVGLVRRRSGPGAGRFANAVLRQVAGADLGEWARRLGPDPDVDRLGHLAFVHLHPRWVVAAVAEALGDDDRLPAVLAADNEPPRVTVAALPGRCQVGELVAAGARPGRWAATAAVLPPGDPGQVPAVAQGRARVQDEGSQLVTLALAAAPGPQSQHGPQGAWADLCAGPGGKAALLAALAERGGTVLLAGEVQPHRARLVRQALVGAGLEAGSAVVQADATAPAWRADGFARVLVDVPCTGLGALRRRPEARWRRQPADLDTLVPLQRRLLAVALDSACPGGVVGYATCSPHRAETVEVVRAVLAARDDVDVLDASALLPAVPDAARGAHLQLWPDRHGTDAMFLAVLRRRTARGA